MKQVILDIKRDVIEQNGGMYRLDTIDKFNEQMQTETNKSAVKLSQEIDRVVDQIMQGDTNDRGDVLYSTPVLEVHLEDEELEDNVDLFIQIVGKHMAVERFLQY